MSITPHTSQSKEMYVKALAELSPRGTVAINRLADRLGVTPVSAGEMVKRLSQTGLMQHVPYRGVHLTNEGRALGSSVLRRQRLWECFLSQYLHIPWPRLYELTCELEHATDSIVTDALEAFLGFPARCPHGNPIPDAVGNLIPLEGVPLCDVQEGTSVEVIAVQERSVEILEHLAASGLLPTARLTVLERGPLDGPLSLCFGTRTVSVGLNLAGLVLVKPLPDEEPVESDA